MSASKNALQIRRLCVASLLCAFAIQIPIVSPIKIQIPPMSFTLGSHLTIFIAMFISPAIGITVELGASLGFLLAGFPPVVVLRALSQIFFVAAGAYILKNKPEVMSSPLKIFLFGIFLNIIHGIAEALVVTYFWFNGMTHDGTFLSTVIGLVGFGTLVHGMLDYYLGILVWRPVSRVTQLPASWPR